MERAVERGDREKDREEGGRVRERAEEADPKIKAVTCRCWVAAVTMSGKGVDHVESVDFVCWESVSVRQRERDRTRA